MILNFYLPITITIELDVDSEPAWQIFKQWSFCNIYISRLCYNVSVRLSVTEVYWRIIANFGFKFRSHLPRIGRRAAGGRRAACRAACGRIISRHASQC